MANTVKFTINIDTQAKGVATASVDVDKLKEALGGVEKEAHKAGAALANWAQTTIALESINNLVGKLNGQIQQAASSFDDFDKAMRAANTMMGLGEEGFQDMKRSLSEISKEIPKTRTELAEGLYQVISNGVTDPVEALKLLETSAKSSVGGIADLGQVVGVSATIWKNYGLDASAAADIQDKIQLTAKNGVTSFEQLAAALPRVSGNAATLGVSIDELFASFATLTGVSGNTAEVSTQLGAIFTALVKPSSEAAKMAEDMGIQFNAAAIKAAGGFQPFLQQLDQSVKAYATASGTLEQEVYGRLFGSAEALRSLIPLQGELASTYTANIDMMANSTGTMDEAFNQMASTGEAARIMLSNSVQAVTDWATGLASAAAPTLQYIATIGDFGTSIGGIATGINTAKAALSDLQIVTKLQTVAQAALNAIMSANPIAIVVISIAAATAGLYALYQNCETFRTAINEAWDAVSDFAGIIGDILVTSFKVLLNVLKIVFGWISKTIMPVINALIKFFGNLAAIVINKIVYGFKMFGKAISIVWNALKKMLVSLGLLDEDTKAVENQTDAIKEEAEAVEDLNEAINKGGTINTGVTGKKEGKKAAPSGSLAALGEEIKNLQAKVDIEVDPQKRVALYKELEALKREKLRIEAVLEFNADPKKLDNIVTMTKKSLDNKDLTKGGLRDVNAMIKKSEDAAKASEELEKSERRRQETEKDGFEIAQMTAQSFGQMGDAIGGAAGDMMQWAAQQVNAIAQIIPQIIALMTAKEGEAIGSATASGASLPFPANIAAIGAGVASVVAAFAKIPKFANGGIISGPTIGLMGEYSGASNNPEVVAPLNKLRSMLTVDGGGSQTIVMKQRGRDLVGVLNRESRIRSRQ